MAQATDSSLPQQFAPQRRRLADQQGLPFLEVLSRPLVAQACRASNHTWRDRIYTLWITLGIFLSQALSDDHSYDDATSP
jgi:hypothetical protein